MNKETADVCTDCSGKGCLWLMRLGSNAHEFAECGRCKGTGSMRAAVAKMLEQE